MFDLGWPEMLVIVVVALLVIGPKDLPTALRTIMGIVRRMRGLAREFHRSLDELARESGLDDVKREFDNVKGLGHDDDVRDALSPVDDLTPDLPSGNSILSPELAARDEKTASAEERAEKSESDRAEATAGDAEKTSSTTAEEPAVSREKPGGVA
ncbi:MAG: Sec-independent protein translocase protein TatB [Alphaproteobacteria bacterium]